MNRRPCSLFLLCIAAAASLAAATSPAPLVQVGVAKIDITPDLPIRLAGYQSRQTDTERIGTKLFARALAFNAPGQKPVVLITVELVGVGAETANTVAAALRAKHGIERPGLAIAATHSHSSPALADVLPFMFSAELPPESTERIQRYTASLREKLLAVAESALQDRKPARLSWAEGKSDFAVHRRKVVDGKAVGIGIVPEGPADHALPVLRVTDERGGLRAVFLSYACHCTTLQGGDNLVHSDWAGDGAAKIEAAHPNAVALVALGCAGDANPNVRGLAAVGGLGDKVAAEVERLLAAPMRPLGPVTIARFREIELPFDKPTTREDLQARLEGKPRQAVAYAATKFLERLDAGKPMPQAVRLPIQAWMFGDELAMVFLGGEVVSEYSLRLRQELDGARLWVNAYSNSLPSYVAGKRMFSEGGYEVDSSMDYYGWPSRLAIETEDSIIKTVHEMVPASFKAR